MNDVPNEVISDIVRVLSSLRSSLDAVSLTRFRPVASIEDHRAAYLALEDIRYRFRAELGQHRSSERSYYYPDVIGGLRDNLERLLLDDEHRRVISEARFRLVPSSPPGSLWLLHPALKHDRLTVAEAISLFIDSLSELPHQLSLIDGLEADKGNSPARLRKMLPQQKVSPLQFDIVHGRIAIAPQPAQAQGVDAVSASSAKRELISAGEKLLDELRRSNCDPRLVENITELQAQLAQETDIVRLGIANLGCSAMCERFEAELPDAVGAMLKTQTVGISMYVAQFPEWLRFSENAASAEIDEDLTRAISETAKQVVEALQKTPQLAEPEVPRVIGYLQSLINNPSRSLKRSAFAVLRTLENMIIAIYSYGADIFEQTMKKSSDPLSSGASKILVVGLLSLALSSAANLAPVSVQVQGSQWLRKASELVEKQLDQFKLGS